MEAASTYGPVGVRSVRVQRQGQASGSDSVSGEHFPRPQGNPVTYVPPQGVPVAAPRERMGEPLMEAIGDRVTRKELGLNLGGITWELHQLGSRYQSMFFGVQPDGHMNGWTLVGILPSTARRC